MKPKQFANHVKNQPLNLLEHSSNQPSATPHHHRHYPLSRKLFAGRPLIKQPWVGKLCLGLLGGLTVLLVSMPAAYAGRLQSWRFDAGRNRLDFRTSSNVQPRAQLVFNPTRLVIDLPGVNWGRPALTQPGRGNIQAVRIAQFERGVTRIVVELNPGYTMDPNQVQFRGNSPTNWSVQLPQPIADPNSGQQPVGAQTPIQIPTQPYAGTGGGTSTGTTVSGAGSPQPISGPQLADVQATPEGLYIRTAGGVPATVQVQRSRNRREVYVILEGIALSDKLQNYVLELNRYGIGKLQLNQLAGSSPSARLTLFIDPAAPNWQASVDPSGGIALVPAGGVTSIAGANVPRSSFSLLGNLAIAVPPGGNPNPNLPVVRNPRNPGFPSPSSPPLNTPPPNNPPPNNPPQSNPPPPRETGRITTITGIDLGGDQLLIRADRPINFISRTERGGRLRLFIRDAQFSPGFQQPRLAVGSPIIQVQYRQENDRMISILFTPADGVRIQGSQLFSGNAILVQLQRRDRPSDSGPVAVPFPNPVPTPEPDPSEGLGRPRRSDGRTVVVIDPGHGGRDPGAIGIGGIRETNIVMDISLEVARVLQQQGVIVRLTRSSEVEVDLAPRVSLAERSDADVFVSIHANAISMSRPDINGIETFSGPGRPRSARLAASIHNSVLSSINMQSRGLKQARFYVLTRTSMPSALVETGFVTGSDDAPNLASPAWRRRMAQAIARGIVQYLRSAGQL